MVADLLLYRERALAEQSNEDIRRKAYMEIMRLLWEEKRYASFGLTAQNLRDRAAQAIKDRERNRQRDMDVQNANDECSDVTERPVDEFRDGNQERNTQAFWGNLHERGNIRNANHVSSDEHLNVPVQFQWGDLRGEVFVQLIEVAY